MASPEVLSDELFIADCSRWFCGIDVGVNGKYKKYDLYGMAINGLLNTFLYHVLSDP